MALGVKLTEDPGLVRPHRLDPVPLVLIVLHEALHDPNPAPVLQPHLLHVLHHQSKIEINKPKVLKVAKEVQMADRCLIDLIVDRFDG